MKDLESTNHSKHTENMRPIRKHILCELKEYQEDISNAKTLMLATNISTRKSCDPQKNTFYVD